MKLINADDLIKEICDNCGVIYEKGNKTCTKCEYEYTCQIIKIIREFPQYNKEGENQ